MPIDYIDPDVAYFLGLVTARGSIQEVGGVRRLTIEFPFRNLEAEGITKKIEQRTEILLSLDMAVRRVNELADVNIRKNEGESSVYLTIETLKPTMFWRNVVNLMRGKTTHYEFDIPAPIFESDLDVKKEFMRGYADVAGSARASNRNKWGKHRIYLDVLNPNWHLPIQLCHLLQDHLKIPVDTITWGHPIVRDPRGIYYKKGQKDFWAKEHQIKVFAEDFEKVGFYMSHKREILEELADYNRRTFKSARFCNPPKRKRPRKTHPAINSRKLPVEIRGKKYGSTWEICADLGCVRFANYMKTQTRLPSVRPAKKTSSPRRN